MMERLAVPILLVLFLPGPAMAATLGELEAWCAPPNKGGRPNLCQGYLAANLELLASPDPASNGGAHVCVPVQEDRARIVGLMRGYAHRHPEARGQDSVTGLGKALEGHFPCRGE